MHTFAANTSTKDFSEIKELDTKYSYGTVFWTDDTQIIPTKNNTASIMLVKDTSNGTCYYFGAKADETIEIRITNCALDKNGNICDIIMKTTDNIVYPADSGSDYLGQQYGDLQTDRDKFTRIALDIGRYSDTNLLHCWLRCNYTSTHFTMRYVIPGTDSNADIEGCVASIYDMDAQTGKYTTANSEWYYGSEFFTTDGADADIYYQKNYWLTEINDEHGIGVGVPRRNEAGTNLCPINSNRFNRETSLVVVQNFSDSTYRMFYGGSSCGLAYTFASPIPFKTAVPTLSVDKELVFEDETFNYEIHQYIPNNYYAKALGFIDGIEGYNSLVISDKLNANLSIISDITISNELGENVSSSFELNTKNNIVTAAATKDALSDVDFYSHLYTINIPVSFNKGAGKTLSGTENAASTTINGTVMNTDRVYTGLKYNYTADASIDHGTVSVNNQPESLLSSDKKVLNHGSNIETTVTFSCDDGYEISAVTIDGKAVSISDIRNNAISLSDNYINCDINHSIVIHTKLKKGSVTANYIDEKGNKLVESLIINGNIFEEYSTTPKNIPYYTLISVPDNANGILTEKTITVNYIYRRNISNVTINYIDSATGIKLSDSVIQAFNQGESYNIDTAAHQDIQYYTIESIDGDTSGIIDKDIIINIFYSRNRNLITVNFLDYITGEIISPLFSQLLSQGTDYNVTDEAAKNIPYYTYFDAEGNTYGVLLNDETINSYYIRNMNTITIRYLDKATNEELSASEVINQFQGTNYDVSQSADKEIPCYNYDSTIGNTSGFLMENVEITIYYTVKDTSVIVNYLDEAGNKLTDSITADGKVFDKYTTENKTFYGYELTELPVNASGEMTEDTIIVDYIYRLKDSCVTINYVDMSGKQLTDSIVIKGKVFDTYTTEPREINGYVLHTSPDNKNGTMQEETIAVTYVYEKEKLPVTDIPIPTDKPIKSPDTGADYFVFITAVILISAMFDTIIILFFKYRIKPNPEEAL